MSGKGDGMEKSMENINHVTQNVREERWNGEIHGKYLSCDPECPERVIEMEKSMENIHNLPKNILR